MTRVPRRDGGEDLAFQPVRVGEEEAEPGPEVGHEAVAGPSGHQAVADRVERLLRSGLQPDMIDPPPPEDRPLPVRLLVPVELEDVELRMRADLDQGQPHPFLG